MVARATRAAAAREPSLMVADGMLITATNGVHACCRSSFSITLLACYASPSSVEPPQGTVAGSEAAWQQAATL